MDASVWVAKTGLTAQQRRMTVIANNLANVNTVAFKRDRAVFEDLLYQNIRQPGASADAQTIAPTGLMMGTGSRIIATEKLHEQGNMMSTENALDVAVLGRGMFQVLQADGTFAYTRDGSFKLNDQGQIVTASGQQLVPAVNIPTNAAAVTIGRDGTVSVELANGGGSSQIGTIQISRFVNEAGLQPMGRNLYRETTASGPVETGTPGLAGFGELAQGSLEASNVNVVAEMVSMIETQRAYEVNSKAISAADGMLRFLNQNL
ncbi:flagellar basal-body rod protein FlgG [Luminiphilus sp.]|jgi:flagellar basal-body rod protein FlgG|nr:flagellar basal-body rod protein FlgG [Halieaceae bacterium]MDA8553797.1 flagellar basal-body rod protein FlgG [Luminiphilus sp.]MBT6351427.1 flagellar basal-body rod protein FlgG [Halieaceae bacterium]MDA8619990.1 flagellar basal-body rod protein FlgG [Luminiphilus sp.]MDB2365009.1 flagellar basal-body rod protein FlgG [Luminiphilus sp.]|tara:strand:- start:184 stop:969 length:786 start_codon:yes stop_codon:yes gene_type:complete